MKQTNTIVQRLKDDILTKHGNGDRSAEHPQRSTYHVEDVQQLITMQAFTCIRGEGDTSSARQAVAAAAAALTQTTEEIITACKRTISPEATVALLLRIVEMVRDANDFSVGDTRALATHMLAGHHAPGRMTTCELLEMVKRFRRPA